MEFREFAELQALKRLSQIEKGLIEKNRSGRISRSETRQLSNIDTKLQNIHRYRV